MQIPKPGEDTKAVFHAAIPKSPGIVVKPMFGNLGAFVNGNMFAGLFGDAIGVRLPSEKSRDELAAIDGVAPFGPAERPMGGYLALPMSWLAEPELMTPWIERALSEMWRSRGCCAGMPRRGERTAPHGLLPRCVQRRPLGSVPVRACLALRLSTR